MAAHTTSSPLPLPPSIQELLLYPGFPPSIQYIPHLPAVFIYDPRWEGRRGTRSGGRSCWKGLVSRGRLGKSMRVTQVLITPSKPRAPPHFQAQYGQVILEVGVTDSLGIWKSYASSLVPSIQFSLGPGSASHAALPHQGPRSLA